MKTLQLYNYIEKKKNAMSGLITLTDTSLRTAAH